MTRARIATAVTIVWLSNALELALMPLMGIVIITALLAGNLPLMWFLLVLMLALVAAEQIIKHIDYRRNGCTDAYCDHRCEASEEA